MEINLLHLYRSKNSTDRTLYKVIAIGSSVGKLTEKSTPVIAYASAKNGEVFFCSLDEFKELMEEEDRSMRPSPTFNMSLKERIEHVGGTINDDHTVRFGSVMAVDAFIRQNFRDCNLAAPYDTPVGQMKGNLKDD